MAKDLLIRLVATTEGGFDKVVVQLEKLNVVCDRMSKSLDVIAKSVGRVDKNFQELSTKGLTMTVNEMNKVSKTTDAAGQSLDRFHRHTQLAANQCTSMKDVLSMTKKELEYFSFNVWKVAMNVALWGGVFTGAAAAVNKLVETGARYNGLSEGFKAMAAAHGDMTQAIMENTKASTFGLISEMDIMKNYNAAVALRVNVNAESMATLSGAAVKMSRVMGVDVNHALDSLITGLGRQSIRVLDNIGIIMKAEEAYKAYADQIGKKASALTDAEKRTAFFSMAIERLKENAEKSGKTILTLGESFVQAKVAIGDTVAKVMAYVVSGNDAASMSENISSMTEKFTKTLWDNRYAIRDLVLEVVGWLKTMWVGVAATVEWIIKHEVLLTTLAKTAVLYAVVTIITSITTAMRALGVATLHQIAMTENMARVNTAAFVKNEVTMALTANMRAINLSSQAIQWWVSTKQTQIDAITRGTLALRTSGVEVLSWGDKIRSTGQSMRQWITTEISTLPDKLRVAGAAIRGFVFSIQGMVIIGYALGKAFAWAFDQMYRFQEGAANTSDTIKNQLKEPLKGVKDELIMTSHGLQMMGKTATETMVPTAAGLKEIARASKELNATFEDPGAATYMRTQAMLEISSAYKDTLKEGQKYTTEDTKMLEKNLLQNIETFKDKSQILMNYSNLLKNSLKQPITAEMVVESTVNAPRYIPGSSAPAKIPGIAQKSEAQNFLGMPKLEDIQNYWKQMISINNSNAPEFYKSMAMDKYADKLREIFKMTGKDDYLVSIQEITEALKAQGLAVGELPKGFIDTVLASDLAREAVEKHKQSIRIMNELNKEVEASARYFDGLAKESKRAQEEIANIEFKWVLKEQSPIEKIKMQMQRDLDEMKKEMLTVASVNVAQMFQAGDSIGEMQKYIGNLKEVHGALQIIGEEQEKVKQGWLGQLVTLSETAPLMANFMLGFSEQIKSTGEIMYEFGQQMQQIFTTGIHDMIMSLVTGTESITDVFKNFGKNILSAMATLVASLVANWVMVKLGFAKADALGAAAALAVAKVKNAAADATTTSSSAAMAAQVTAVYASMGALGIAPAAATIAGFEALIAGAAAVSKGLVAGLKITTVASAAAPAKEGMWQVPGSTTAPFPATLHGQEMVVPAPQAERIREFVERTTGGGSQSLTLHVSVGNGGEPVILEDDAALGRFAAMLAQRIVPEVQRGMRANTMQLDPYGLRS